MMLLVLAHFAPGTISPSRRRVYQAAPPRATAAAATAAVTPASRPVLPPDDCAVSSGVLGASPSRSTARPPTGGTWNT